MKRMCSYLGGFLIVILMFPLLVLADVGAPELGDYDVIISNKDGASLYDYNYNVIDKIPYDTKMTKVRRVFRALLRPAFRMVCRVTP